MELSALALGIIAQAGGAYTTQDLAHDGSPPFQALAHSRCLPNAGPGICR